ncbi:MAG TPA: type I methionyl aminopeptidase [Victivallales bacterium]|nr:type I methionyl aminopeptidase [Victivallales bacterium]
MKLKNIDEIKLMREAGLLLWETHQIAKNLMESGVTTKEVDTAVESFILSRKAIPLFKGVPGVVPYPGSVCISINEQIVHGMPSKRKLEEGDIVSLDIGVKINGWCADAAVTHSIGEVDNVKAKLVNVTEDVLRYAIKELGNKKYWSQISKNMQKTVENAGFSVVRDLVGHGIGTSMWERPQVANYHSRETDDFRIRPGLVIAVEPMVNAGSYKLCVLEDGWTICTIDGKPSAHFEHSIAITEDGPIVLTCGPNDEGWSM